MTATEKFSQTASVCGKLWHFRCLRLSETLARGRTCVVGRTEGVCSLEMAVGGQALYLRAVTPGTGIRAVELSLRVLSEAPLTVLEV